MALIWPVCRLWLACSGSFLPPPPGSVCLSHYYYRSWYLTTSSSSTIVGPLLGYAQSWYCTASLTVVNALNRRNDWCDHTSMVINVVPQLQWFSHVSTITLSSPSGPIAPSRINSFLCLRGACGRVWVSLLYVSMNCFLTCLEYIILGTRQGGFFL